MALVIVELTKSCQMYVPNFYERKNFDPCSRRQFSIPYNTKSCISFLSNLRKLRASYVSHKKETYLDIYFVWISITSNRRLWSSGDFPLWSYFLHGLLRCAAFVVSRGCKVLNDARYSVRSDLLKYPLSDQALGRSVWTAERHIRFLSPCKEAHSQASRPAAAVTTGTKAFQDFDSTLPDRDPWQSSTLLRILSSEKQLSFTDKTGNNTDIIFSLFKNSKKKQNKKYNKLLRLCKTRQMAFVLRWYVQLQPQIRISQQKMSDHITSRCVGWTACANCDGFCRSPELRFTRNN